MYKEQVDKNGFITEKIDDKINLPEEIEKLKNKKNAVILAHYYVKDEVQEIADFVGDSLALSQKAAKTEADIILFAGVHFMAETAKILSPQKKVLLPDLNAGCSLADSCPAKDFESFAKKYPEHTVVSYVNTTADVKALTDIICTSSNAKQIIESIPEEEKILFAPDRNLGNWISRQTGREMVIWDGACHVHNEFSLPGIIDLKNRHPEAKLISHPECQKPVLEVSDFIGSTSNLINFTKTSDAEKFIVATEPGVIREMKLANPEKEFLPAPGEDAECACNECEFMRTHDLAKVYNTLKYEIPEIKLDENIRKKALKPIERMLEISEKLGL